MPLFLCMCGFFSKNVCLCVIDFTQTQTPHRFGAMPGITAGLVAAKKSYVERRGWLHPVKSFFRVFAFMAISFHFLTCIAFLEYLSTSVSPPTTIKGITSCLFFLILSDRSVSSGQCSTNNVVHESDRRTSVSVECCRC